MSHNDQQDKRPRSGGPEGHPSNQAPSKSANNNRDGTGRVANRNDDPGGNKVTQGQGRETGNKGKQ
jgi:hypothetical protein